MCAGVHKKHVSRHQEPANVQTQASVQHYESVMRAKPEAASASRQKVRLRRTDDDAHQTLIARGPRGSPLGAVHSAVKQSGPKQQRED